MSTSRLQGHQVESGYELFLYENGWRSYENPERAAALSSGTNRQHVRVILAIIKHLESLGLKRNENFEVKIN